MRLVIVPEGVGVEHLARVEGVVASILQPHRQVVLIMAVLDEDGEAAWIRQIVNYEEIS